MPRRITEVVARRGLPPLFADWLLTVHQGRFWLFGILDIARIGRLEQYTSEDLLHHLSTAIGGRPVVLSNTSGLRYAVLLSRPPRLPRRAEFPGLQRGVVLLGITASGQTVAVPWSDPGALLVAGITGAASLPSCACWRTRRSRRVVASSWATWTGRPSRCWRSTRRC